MALHWTYQAFDEESDLQQGDILVPTPALKNLFAEVHSHFCNDKYLAFLVASQSCDLVRHKNKKEPKAKYIALSAVRSLDSVIQKLVRSVCEPVAPGVFPANKKGDARQLIERILNQNEQALGVFYLHPSDTTQIGVPSVAMLRVSISVRAEHYEKLVRSRSARLASDFQAKMGWLMGNLYNRPATPDWGDREGGADEFQRLIRDYVGSSFIGIDAESSTTSRLAWVEDSIAVGAINQGLDLLRLSRRELDKLRPTPAIELAIQELSFVLKDVAPGLDSEAIELFSKRLRNNQKFKRLLGKPSA